MRARKGMALARSKGKLRQEAEAFRLAAKGTAPDARTGEYSIGDLAEALSISRQTVYRTLERQAGAVLKK